MLEIRQQRLKPAGRKGTNRYSIYFPTRFFTDSAFPFKPTDKLKVYVDDQNRIVIEKESLSSSSGKKKTFKDSDPQA